jgi:hypothetical protein
MAPACLGLTACGGSSGQPPAAAAAAQNVQAYKQQRTELLELVSCARRHGIDLPEPTPQNKVNLRGVNLKSPRRKAELTACYKEVVKKTERAEQEAGAKRRGEEPSAATSSAAAQRAAAFAQERERLTEVVSCARRHGIHLPEPDSRNNINTRGLNLEHGHNKAVMDACVRAVSINASQEQEALAREQQNGPKRLGEEPTG